MQDGLVSIMEIMNYFHDHIIILLTIIIIFVSYIFILVLLDNNIDRYTIDSHILEFIWTIVPIIFLLFIALPSLYLLYLTEDHPYSYIKVKVIGHQWYWDYEYTPPKGETILQRSYILNSSEDIYYRCLDVDNRLYMAHNSPVILMITSADVLHSWTIPSFGVKADAIPGRLNYIIITPRNYGVFYGQCSELCGSNHSFIPISVEVVNMKDFLTYVYNLE